MSQSRYTNIAFISYKREDEEWAKWLQNKLEHYKLPTEIAKANPELEFKDRSRHVFKDTTDLSGGVLAKAIKEGLESSKYLVVICSPCAAKSPWVCKEVQEFIDSGREENIIPFIIDGEPNSKDPDKECLPSDNIVRIWDAKTGEVLEQFNSLSDFEIDSFSPNGKRVISATNCYVQIWENLQTIIDQTSEKFKNYRLTSDERKQFYL